MKTLTINVVKKNKTLNEHSINLDKSVVIPIIEIIFFRTIKLFFRAK